MIYTTYFANLKNLDKAVSCPISICAKAPNDYYGLQYKQLSPSYELLMHWKQHHDSNYYEYMFYNFMLFPMNPYDVLEDFRRMINNRYQIGIEYDEQWWEKVPFDIYLVCYERPDDFCHRHLVANWLGEYNIKVREAGQDAINPAKSAIKGGFRVE